MRKKWINMLTPFWVEPLYSFITHHVPTERADDDMGSASQQNKSLVIVEVLVTAIAKPQYE